jgi:hypothetical protein
MTTTHDVTSQLTLLERRTLLRHRQIPSRLRGCRF